MLIAGIDPGTSESGVAVMHFDADGPELRFVAKLQNSRVVDTICEFGVDHVIVEMLQNSGHPVGSEVYKTLMWIGRFFSDFEHRGIHLLSMFRKTAVAAVTGNAKDGDSAVRKAVLGMFPQTGGGKEPAIGTQKLQGPLYTFDIKGSDMIAAMSICIAGNVKNPGSLSGVFGYRETTMHEIVGMASETLAENMEELRSIYMP